MLGTQLGIPGLVCFVAYVALCFRGRARHSVRAGLGRQPPNGWQGTANPTLDGSGGQGTASPALDGSGGQRTASPTLDGGGGQRTAGPALSEEARRARSDAPYRIACRAGALVCLVAFWFDGGLFKLATASVFWILLELGAETRFKPQMDTDEHRFGAGKERLKPAAPADDADSADPKQESASIREIRGLSLTASLPRKRINQVSVRFLRPLTAIRMQSGN